MSDYTTIARPYAKAIFECAEEHNDFTRWSSALQILAAITLDTDAVCFLDNPNVTEDQQSALILAILREKLGSELPPAVEQGVRLLAHNKRLNAATDIYVQFEKLRADQEKTLSVDVLSYSALSLGQERELIQSLSARLQRQVTLSVKLDASLLGGAVIRAGDLVIDGSVRGKLTKLATALVV
jgi:F-type H+-transporting ATPase subunit delta